MIYQVKYDGLSIFDIGVDMMLSSPSLQIELNTAGSFEFIMPPTHQYYNVPKLLTSDVEVVENGVVIWTGRPVEIKTDFFKRKRVYCEGALAYFNDSIQRPAEYDSISISTFFRTLIANHNSQVAANRRFIVGNIGITEKNVYRKLDYESTFDALRTMCIEAEGGYFFIRRESGVNYIDWYGSNMPDSNSQPIQYALNLTDLSSVLSGSEIRTAAIPLGKADSNGNKLTVTDVNGGKDYVAVDAAATYGLITTVVEFSNIENKTALLEAGKKWLINDQFDPLSIEVDAADLHYINSKYDKPFRVGQTVHCTSNPHLIDKDFPLIKISLSLDTAIKKITIGTPQKTKLTEIYKKDGTLGSSRSGLELDQNGEEPEIIDNPGEVLGYG